MPLDEETLPQVLSRAGYRRHGVGELTMSCFFCLVSTVLPNLSVCLLLTTNQENGMLVIAKKNTFQPLEDSNHGMDTIQWGEVTISITMQRRAMTCGMTRENSVEEDAAELLMSEGIILLTSLQEKLYTSFKTTTPCQLTRVKRSHFFSTLHFGLSINQFKVR